MMIVPIEGGYIASLNSGPLPGVYATIRAAQYATRFSVEELERIDASRSTGLDYRPITVECLHEWRYGRDGRT